MRPSPMTITMEDPRSIIVQAAIGEVGAQEAVKYWRDVYGRESYDYPKAWGGAFAMWCVNQARDALDLPPLQWDSKGTGFGFTPKDLTREPLPGDIAYFAYFPQPYQHHAIVELCDRRHAGADLYTIDGNQGRGDLVATRLRRLLSPASPVYFYSIARFL